MFDEQYYEDGVRAGVSCYENYRWMPELTIPCAKSIVEYLKLPTKNRILDFGCAKGFFVRALRQLGYNDSWGCDISAYATDHCSPEMGSFIKLSSEDDVIPFNLMFDIIIAKDVLEHLSEERLRAFFDRAGGCCSRIFVIIPLASHGVYINPKDELDITHIQRKSLAEWSGLFNCCGWTVEAVCTNIGGVKEAHQLFPGSVGFFDLRRS